MFNSTCVLIRQLKDRFPKPERVLLGPMPKPTVQMSSDPWQTGPDPWTNWQRQQSIPAQPAVNRPTAGPTEKRLADQDTQIKDLQVQMKQLADEQQKNNQTIQQQFSNVEKQQAQNMQQVQSALLQCRTDMEQSFAKNMHQYSTAMENKLDELKNLFISTKRKGREGGDEAME